MKAVLTPIDSQIQNQICCLVCETIVKIQTQQPELLQEKYRTVPWSNNTYREGLNTKLAQVLDSAADWSILLQRVQKFLTTILIPEAFKSPEFAQLKSQVNNLKQAPEAQPKNAQKTEATVKTENIESQQQLQVNNYFSLLLLNAESLKLTIETEKFIAQICNFPLQTKIAIADWSQQDTFSDQLYQRGYDLLHIPGDNLKLDGRIATFATSIPEKFPQVKEVLICTSVSVCDTGDNPIENLCHQLQQSGLTVYRITQAENKIFAVNQQTRESHIHNLIPTFEQFTSAIAQIIHNEEAKTGNQWIGVSKMAEIFTSKYEISLDTVVKHHLPGQSIQDVLKGKSDFITHQPSDNSEIYLTQFRLPNT